jgi:rubrerythrin
MTGRDAIDEILDFAIGEEQLAADFYTRLASSTDRPAMREVFSGFAREELGHKAKLEAVKRGAGTGGGARVLGPGEAVPDLKIGDYLVDVEPDAGGDLDYQKALTIAMKKEKAAFRLYTDLAGSAGTAELKAVFLGLAQEEARHKLRFEIEYDEYVLREN